MTQDVLSSLLKNVDWGSVLAKVDLDSLTKKLAERLAPALTLPPVPVIPGLDEDVEGEIASLAPNVVIKRDMEVTDLAPVVQAGVEPLMARDKVFIDLNPKDEAGNGIPDSLCARPHEILWRLLVGGREVGKFYGDIDTPRDEQGHPSSVQFDKWLLTGRPGIITMQREDNGGHTTCVKWLGGEGLTPGGAEVHVTYKGKDFGAVFKAPRAD
jgi:hypothetical protein